MAKLLRSLLRKTLFGKRNNLISLDDPFPTLARLVQGRRVRFIVDAGASDGRVSRRLLACFPEATVFAFEPNPLYAEPLRAFASSEPRFRPQQIALAAAPGQRTLHVTRSAGGTSLFQPTAELREYAAPSAEVLRLIEVSTMRLDDWAEGEGVAGIDVLKLDVQGGELDLLDGARRLLKNSVAIIYTEVLFHPLYEHGALFGQIDQFLREMGFALFNLYGPKADRRGALLWANAIYTRIDG